ncbi:MAG: pyruvate kinase [Saprospiraceae bacterium]|jgi:pyruvate kinase
MKFKSTKIIATLGPASSSHEVIKEMYMNGMNVCRLNFSHGEYDVHKKNMETIAAVNKEVNGNIAILADLQGPKLRVGMMESEDIIIKNGNKIIFSTNECIGTEEKVFLTYQRFPQDVQAGEKILIDDGKLTVRVESTNGVDEVICVVEHGGPLKSRKGVNLPNTNVSLPSLTEKDRKDLNFILEQDVEWIALSFVRTEKCITDLREIIQARGHYAKIIAKIEKPEAIENIDEIIEATDALMVARGDLGVEVPYQDVPLLQKMMAKKCLKQSKPIIVATQMMESMIEGVTPSRAEVNDVANAVMDGADAVMLSGETSVGDHPALVIQTMTNIVTKVEDFEDAIYNHKLEPARKASRFISDNICESAVQLASSVQAKAIVTMTQSGYTAFKISSHRPKSGIYVFTSNRRILNMVSLIWGVKGFFYNDQTSTSKTIEDLQVILEDQGLLEKGEYFININATPIEDKGMANTLKLGQA